MDPLGLFGENSSCACNNDNDGACKNWISVVVALVYDVVLAAFTIEVVDFYQILPSLSAKVYRFSKFKIADPIWHIECTKVQNFLIKSCFHRSLAVKCHFSNSHHEEFNDNEEYLSFNFFYFFIQFFFYFLFQKIHIQWNLNVWKFIFIRVLLQNSPCNSVIDIQCNI